MKKVVHVNFTMNIGGIESFIMNVMRNIDRSQFTPMILTYSSKRFDHEDELSAMKVQIVRITNPNEISLYKHIKELIGIFRKHKFDVVHSHTYFDSVFVTFAAMFAGVKMRVVHSHTALAHTEKRLHKRLKWMIGRVFLRFWSSDMIACSYEAGTALFGENAVFRIIPNGIDLNKFSYDAGVGRRIRRALGIARDAKVVGHVGRLDTPKNHTFLLDIFKSYLEIEPLAVLVCVGSGALESTIHTKIVELNIQDRVILTGDRSDINALLSAFDSFVFPSIYEGLPVSLIEAQANGLPIIMSTAVSSEAVVTNAVKVLSLSDGPSVWARCIEKLSRIVVGDSHANIKLQNFSITNTVNVLESIYSKRRE